jgi:putative iron-dependent peroxidase
MVANEPQGGILPEPPESALFLILDVRDRARDGRKVARALARAPELTRKLARGDPRARLRCMVSLGPELWDVVSPERRPRGLHAFQALEADGRSAPATGGDVLLHLLSRRTDFCFELALRLRRELGETVAVKTEVHGFRYFDLRDFTGFIEGTENPKGRERAEVALIGAEDPPFAGCSFVFTQRYVHDLAKWGGLSIHEQELVFGRTKRASRELSDRAKPPTAHIARTEIEEDGKELEIVRHGFPYGTTSERGIFFMAYTKDLTRPEKMLRRMVGTAGDGLHDRLLEFTRAVSGANFFAPSLRLLRSLGAD